MSDIALDHSRLFANNIYSSQQSDQQGHPFLFATFPYFTILSKRRGRPGTLSEDPAIPIVADVYWPIDPLFPNARSRFAQPKAPKAPTSELDLDPVVCLHACLSADGLFRGAERIK